MSLLLDALKKAAEQKAEKNKREVSQAGSSNLTRPDATDSSDFDDTADTNMRQARRVLRDETEIDISEPNARLDDPRVEPTDVSGTGPETSATETTSLSAQMQTGEDKSIIFAEDDVADFMGEPELVSRAPRAPEAETDLSQVGAPEGDSGAAGLELIDTARHPIPPGVASAADPTQTSTTDTTDASATTGVAINPRTGAATRSEATSTRSYAPDNYDRTLMRLPSDDASSLFAGMKSDSDIVMTPEYAKKMFHSKSSAQRMQHYKFYGGILCAILLAIVIYALFEYQDQSELIDTNLLPLKRDPMPGIIRPEKAATGDRLFAELEVDERAIEIIEKADQTPLSDTQVSADENQSEAVSAVDVADPEIPTDTAANGAAETAAEPAMADAETPTELEAASKNTTATAATTAGASQAQSAAASSAAETASSTLEISLGRRVAQKNVWLRDAYAAYQAGNDELAINLYRRVLEVEPQNRNALLGRAAIHVQNSNGPAAIRDYRQLLRANPKDSLALTSLIAVTNYSPRDTETQLKLMIRDEPNSPYLHFALANAYGAQNRWREAQGHYFRALENNPGDPNYAYNLAVSLEHIGQTRSAVSYYRRALDNFRIGLATFSRDAVNQRLELLGQQ